MDKKPLQGNRRMCTTCCKRAKDSGKTTIKLADGSEIPDLGEAGKVKAQHSNVDATTLHQDSALVRRHSSLQRYRQNQLTTTHQTTTLLKMTAADQIRRNRSALHKHPSLRSEKPRK